ncbi:MAG: hypothetical protein IT439_08090 [Phycisphaerales bacterium]|nr:hypothetical protein [Phycisphaerales bacterium]
MEPIAAIGFGIVGLGLLAAAALLFMAGLVPLFTLLGQILRRITGFIAGEAGDALRLAGTALTGALLVPLAAFSVLVGRWSAASHYGKAIQAEVKSFGLCVYRMVIGHPVRLLAVTPLAEGLEKRLPQVVKAAPGKDKPGRRVGQFEGYTIVGSLAGGGSGGKLYVAEPDEIRRAAFARQGHGEVGQVVIKTFSLKDGSSLPQIVRENRSLEAAKRLGLVLDHEMTEERFYYVMKFVPGESLALVTQRLHAQSGPEGLTDSGLRQVAGYVAELLDTLGAYHRGGLWHKDVKPDNIIVEGNKAHLVDVGLVTPLRSAMTLTTHGTEYFRDPELVRMALRGVKVQEVDGGKFDLFAAGAVLYSVIENSFPAHGGLSRISKRCPEALRWVVRRAMTDYDKRYPNAPAMLADLRVVLNAPDPFDVRPVDLPSMKGEEPAPELPVHEVEAPLTSARAGSSVPQGVSRRRPRLAVSNWFTGAYEVQGEDQVAVAPGTPGRGFSFKSKFLGVEAGFGSGSSGKAEPVAPRTPRAAGPRRPAGEQVSAARARAAETRERARQRRAERRAPGTGDYRPGANTGVIVAVLVVVLAVGAGVTLVRKSSVRAAHPDVITQTDGQGPGGRTTPGTTPDAEGPPATPAQVGLGDVAFGPAQIALLGAAGGNQLAKQLLVGNRVVFFVVQEPAVTPEDAAEVDRIVKRVRDAGYQVRGLDPADETATEIEAQLRRARGLGAIDGPETRSAIESWIKAQRAVSFVVWIAGSPGASLRAHLFAPEPSRDLGLDAWMLHRMINDYVRGVIEFEGRR